MVSVLRTTRSAWNSFGTLTRSTPARASTHTLRDLALLAGIAVAAWLTHRRVPMLPLPSTALVLGVSLGSAFSLVPALRRWSPAPEVPLAVGMVLLGAQCDARAIAIVGVAGIALLVAHWYVVGFVMRSALRAAGEEPRAASLVGVGLSGCGISAILAAGESDPATSDRARMLAVASTLVVGAAGFLVLPHAAAALGLDATEIARWAGIAMPTTAEAVLVGGSHSAVALRGTGAFRFAVNLLQWIPVLEHARRFAPTRPADASSSLARTASIAVRRVPAFVWGLGVVAWLAISGAFAADERETLARVTNWAFLMALAGVGFATRPLAILALGWRPLAAALLAWALCASLLLGAIVLVS